MEIVHQVNATNYHPTMCGAFGSHSTMRESFNHFKEIADKSEHEETFSFETIPAMHLQWKRYTEKTAVSVLYDEGNRQLMSVSAYFGNPITYGELFPPFGHLAFFASLHGLGPLVPPIGPKEGPLVLSYTTHPNPNGNQFLMVEWQLGQAFFCPRNPRG
jgi:hypothetical protein